MIGNIDTPVAVVGIILALLGWNAHRIVLIVERMRGQSDDEARADLELSLDEDSETVDWRRSA